MQINITLFVQAFHFAVAYLALRAFVFKPFLRLLEQQERIKEQLYSAVQQEEQGYILQQQEKKTAFAQFKSQLIARMPVFTQEAPVCEVAHLEHADVQSDLSQKEKEEIKKKALDLLR